jgi:hypothetical protein
MQINFTIVLADGVGAKFNNEKAWPSFLIIFPWVAQTGPNSIYGAANV